MKWCQKIFCCYLRRSDETPPPRPWVFVDEKKEEEFEDEFMNRPTQTTTKSNLTFAAIFGSLSLCFRNKEPEERHVRTFTNGYAPKKRLRRSGRRASMSGVEEKVAHLKKDTLPMKFTVSKFDVEREVKIDSEPHWILFFCFL
ncbi:hypothetical protein ACTXT7_001631 [Hymenolepis weldensis]